MADLQISIKLKPPLGADGWLMDAGGGWKAQKYYPEIQVGTGKKAQITFTIMNGQGQDVKFAATPMLTAVTKKKAFENLTVAPNGYSFTVRDTNPDIEKIPYVLMFQGNVPKLDPIVDNGGGNRSFFEFSAQQWVEVGIGLLLALVIGMLVQKKFKPFG